MSTNNNFSKFSKFGMKHVVQRQDTDSILALRMKPASMRLSSLQTIRNGNNLVLPNLKSDIKIADPPEISKIKNMIPGHKEKIQNIQETPNLFHRLTDFQKY